MADLDAVLGELRAAGRRETTGAFTLDAAKAREKLREFQLADPSRYVLLLIQALVIRGAKQIDITTDADDLQIIGHGVQPFTKDELTDLYVLLFDDGPPRPGVREVALALNAAMALDPRWVRLDCAGPDHRGIRLEQRNGGADHLSEVAGVPHGISLHVRERFKVAHFVRFLGSGGHAPERAHIERSLCFAGLPVTINGKQLQTYSPDASVATWTRVRLGERDVGIVGVSPAGDARVALVRHQVWLATYEPASASLVGVRAVLDVSHLKTDASLSAVVRDEEWESLVSALQDAYDIALAGVARDNASSPIRVSRLRAAIFDAIRRLRHARRDPTATPLRELLAMPLWRTLDGRERTTAELLDVRPLRFTSATFDHVPKGFGDVIAGGNAIADTLVALVGKEAIEDATAQVRRAIMRETNHALFRRRRHGRELPPGSPPHALVGIERDGLRGEIAWSPNQGPSWIRFVVDGCLLVELPLDAELGTTRAVVEGPFAPNATFDGVERDTTFAAAIHAVLIGFSEIVRRACETLTRDADGPGRERSDVLDYVIGVLEGTHATRWLAAVGVPASDARALLAGWDAPWEAALARDALARGEHPFARLSCFEDGAGAPLSLHQILTSLGPSGVIPVVSFSRPRLPDPPELVVRADARRLKLLELVVGPTRVRKVGREFERWLAHRRFVESPRDAVAVDLTALAVRATYEHEGLACELSLRRAVDETSAESIAIAVDGRRVSQTAGPAVRGLVGRVELDAKHLNKRCDGVTVSGEREAVAAVSVGLEHLADQIATLADTDRRRADAIIDLFRLACPNPAFARAWYDLTRRAEPDEASAAYAEILALGSRHDPTRVAQVLSVILATTQAFDPDDVRAQLTTAKAQPSSWADYRDAAARALPRLVALPCFPAGGERWLPLSHVFACLAGDSVLRHLPDGTDAPSSFDGVPRFDPVTLSRLGEVLGSDRLVDDSPRLASAAKRAEFESKPRLSELALAPGTALCSIVVAIDTLVGVLGVPRRSPDELPGRVLVCRDRRPIAEIDPVAGTPWIGVLDAPELGHEHDFERLTRREIDWLARTIDNHRPAMLDALCSAGFAGDDGALRRQWAQHLLRCVVERHEHSQPALASEGVGEIADAPLFEDASGSVMTLRDLRARFGKEQRLAFVRSRGLDPGEPALRVRDAIEEALLRHLFDCVEDVEGIATNRTELQAKAASAPPLPDPPVDALAVEKIDTRELRGALWLPAGFIETPTIALGTTDRVLDQWEGSTMCPACGGIAGPGVQLEDDFSGCSLSRSRMDWLKSRATKLYLRLVRELPSGGLAADDPRVPWLRALVERLEALRREGRKWPSHDLRSLHRDLRDVPLFPLPNGRLAALRSIERSNRTDAGPDSPEVDIADDDDDAVTLAAPGEVEGSQNTAPTTTPAPHDEAPTPAAAPGPAPAPPPTPTQRLHAAVLAELRLLFRQQTAVLSEPSLERISFAPGAGRLVAIALSGGARVDVNHPIVVRAMADDADPLLVSLVASAALSALNAALSEISDADEALLVRLHADHLATAAAPRTTGA